MAPLNWSHKETTLTVSQAIFKSKATADECRQIADALELLTCHCIEADYRIIPLPHGRYRVSGQFRSIVEQACVISLEPVRCELAEVFDVEFWPASQLSDIGEIELGDPDAEDPEPFTAGDLNVGHLIYELLASRLEPYPRKQGESFDIAEIENEPSPQADTPFAKLAILKNRFDDAG